jgi:hypothetical protein
MSNNLRRPRLMLLGQAPLRGIATALFLALQLLAAPSSAQADPVVYFYSGDLVYNSGPDPIGLKGAHFSMMTVIDTASAPSVSRLIRLLQRGEVIPNLE